MSWFFNATWQDIRTLLQVCKRQWQT
jgi:hypothetical protein